MSCNCGIIMVVSRFQFFHLPLGSLQQSYLFHIVSFRFVHSRRFRVQEMGSLVMIMKRMPSDLCNYCWGTRSSVISQLQVQNNYNIIIISANVLFTDDRFFAVGIPRHSRDLHQTPYSTYTISYQCAMVREWIQSYDFQFKYRTF